MNRREPDQLGNKLDEFLKPMMTGIGGVERQAALSTYLTGLLLDRERNRRAYGCATGRLRRTSSRRWRSAYGTHAISRAPSAFAKAATCDATRAGSRSRRTHASVAGLARVSVE